MADSKKPYDSAYKYLFSNKVIFHQFLTRFIDEDFARDVRYEDIELVDRNFVSDELLGRESDIIYKIKLNGREIYIFVLVEFQSSVDKSIPVRMLLYILQLYDLILRNSEKGLLPAVFPILLYNGTKNWTIPDNIQSLISPGIPEKYIPSFHYYSVIEKNYSKKVLKKIKGIVSAVIYLENQKDEKQLSKAIDDIIELIQEEQPEEFRMFLKWANRMFRNELDEKSIEKIYRVPEVHNMLSQIAEKIEKKGIEIGIEQGYEKGIEQGILKQRKEDALKMKEKNIPVNIITEITGLTSEEIMNL